MGDIKTSVRLSKSIIPEGDASFYPFGIWMWKLDSDDGYWGRWSGEWFIWNPALEKTPTDTLSCQKTEQVDPRAN